MKSVLVSPAAEKRKCHQIQTNTEHSCRIALTRASEPDSLITLHLEIVPFTTQFKRGGRRLSCPAHLIPCQCSALVAFHRVGILCFSTDAVRFRASFCANSHVMIVVHVPQAIVDNTFRQRERGITGDVSYVFRQGGRLGVLWERPKAITFAYPLSRESRQFPSSVIRSRIHRAQLRTLGAGESRGARQGH